MPVTPAGYLPTPLDPVIMAIKGIRKSLPLPNPASDIPPTDPSLPSPEVVETKAKGIIDEVTRPPRRIIEGAPRIEQIAGEIRSFETLPKPAKMLEVIPSPGDFLRSFPGPFRDIPPPHEFVKNIDRLMDDAHGNSQAVYEIMHARFPVAAKDWSDIAADAHEIRRDLHDLNQIGMEFLKEVGKATTKLAKGIGDAVGEGVPFVPFV